MPRLPSGRDVGVASDPILQLARDGNFQLTVGFTLQIESADDIAPLINITYFNAEEGKDGPGVPYLSGLMVSDIGTEKCDWPVEDVVFFKQWLRSEAAKKWLRNVFDELTELIRTVKAPLPENLRGILD